MGAVVSAAALSAGVVACSSTVTGEAEAPRNVRPYTTTTTPTTTTAPTTAPAPSGGSDLPPQAYEEVRAAGIEGPDSAIADQISLVCIIAAGSFNDSVQDVVDLLKQWGSSLPPDALDTIVRVAIKYDCPEDGPKLGIG